MRNFDWGPIFTSFYNNFTRVENLIDDTSSMQVFTLVPNITIIRVQKIRNKNLTTGIMIFFNCGISSECFLFTNLTMTYLVSLVLFLLSDNQWQPSISMCPISIPTSLQILITLSSRLLSRISWGIPEISTLFLLV